MFFYDVQLQGGLVDDFAGDAGELRHLYAVAAVGRAGFDRVQKDDLVLIFHGVQVDIGDGVRGVGQGGQFKIMRGEQGEGPDLVGEVSGACPRQGHPVVGAGAAAYLVNQREAFVRGVVEDVGGLNHLGHEGGFAGGDVVDRAYAGENAIYGP